MDEDITSVLDIGIIEAIEYEDPIAGDFSWYHDKMFSDALDKTFKAVSNCEAWNYLKTFNPESDMGFMFTRDNIVNSIGVECEKLGADHSGASFAMCMRSMQFISQQVWNKFVYLTFICY